MALSKYTGGGFSNYTYTPSMPLSFHIPPTPPPRYDTTPSYSHLVLRERQRRREKEEARSSLGPSATELLAFHPDRDRVKHRRRRGRLVKRQELEEGAEERSQQPVVQVVAHCGDDATLQCRAPKPDSVDGLEWTRTDLEQYVYLYKDGEPDLTEQHQTFRGRCELKDGTATLVLRNVTRADNGTYECRFVNHDLGVSKRSIISGDPVSVVRLRVLPSGACTGDEEEKDVDEHNEEEEEEEPDGEHLPVATRRNHYVTYGVLGAFGLVVTAFLVLIAL